MTLSVGDVLVIERTLTAGFAESARKYRVVALGLTPDAYSPGGKSVALLETVE